MKFDSNYQLKEVHQGYVYLRAFIISLGGLFFGLNNGCFNTTQEHIAYLNGWFTTFDMSLYQGLITAFVPLGCMVGCLLSAPLMKLTQSNLRIILGIADVIGIVGTLIEILDYNLGNFLLGRFLNGVSGGLNTSVIPLYLSHFTPVIMRGKTGTFTQTFASLGLFIELSLGVIQPVYEKVPKGHTKSTWMQQQISEMTPFHRNTAWRISIGLPLVCCVVRLLFLIMLYKEDTPVQMVQHHHLKTLKNYLNKAYDPERANLRFKEIVEYTKTQDEQVELGSEEDEVGGKLYEFSHHHDAAPKKAPQVTSHQIHTDSHHQIHSSHNINNHESSSHQAVELIKADSHDQHDHNELKIAIQTTQQNGEDHLFSSQKITTTAAAPEIKKAPYVFKSQRRRKYLGIVAQCSAQLTGLNALMFFSSTIYKENSDSQDTVQMYLYIQGFAIFFFTYIAIFFIDKFGRKKLIMVSLVLTMIGLLGIVIFDILDTFMLSFVSIIFYLFGFGIGLGAVVWPYCAELVNKSDLPVCTAIRWFCTLCLGASFKFIMNAIGVSGSFLIFFGFALFAFIYFLKEMKETKGLTPEQIDELFAQ